jgi:hypothetical protein
MILRVVILTTLVSSIWKMSGLQYIQSLVGYKFVQIYMFLFEFFHLSYLKMGYMFSLKNILFSYTIIGFEPNNIYVFIIVFVLKIF